MRNKVLFNRGKLIDHVRIITNYQLFLKYQFFGDPLFAVFDPGGCNFIITPEIQISGTRSKIPPNIRDQPAYRMGRTK